jgi:hypothetical protein
MEAVSGTPDELLPTQTDVESIGADIAKFDEEGIALQPVRIQAGAVGEAQETLGVSPIRQEDPQITAGRDVSTELGTEDHITLCFQAFIGEVICQGQPHVGLYGAAPS